jgi:sugar phosphate permease
MAAMSAIVPLALSCRALYAFPWILAAIIFLTNAGQGIAALVMVVVPTESVPPQFAATSIGLATLTGEIFGATVAPVLGGALAQTHGLAAPLWMSAGGAVIVFLSALFLTESSKAKKAPEG